MFETLRIFENIPMYRLVKMYNAQEVFETKILALIKLKRYLQIQNLILCTLQKLNS